MLGRAKKAQKSYRRLGNSSGMIEKTAEKHVKISKFWRNFMYLGKNLSHPNGA